MMMNKLKIATRDLHEEIEKENLAALIMSHEIKMAEYKLLLLQNFVAYKVTEDQISSHLENFESTRTERLEKDLRHLGVETTIVNRYRDHFVVSGKAEALGAAYVVEGSSLGGMMIARELKNCKKLVLSQSPSFFNEEKQQLNGWKKFKKNLSEINFTEAEEQQAIAKARETFQFFGKVFREVQLQK